ncbi:hypothetical protein IMG5_173710, partial [Ichthyophthirius multifiliis]
YYNKYQKQKMNKPIIIASIALLLTFGSLYLKNNGTFQFKKTSTRTLFEWASCQAQSKPSQCEYDPNKSDIASCDDVAIQTGNCITPLSGSIDTACQTWWTYHDSAKASDKLPDSYTQCVQNCSKFAEKNTFFFENYFKKLWVDCQ